jgi:hypothetical protein
VNLRRLIFIALVMVTLALTGGFLNRSTSPISATGTIDMTGDWASVYSRETLTSAGDCIGSLSQTGSAVTHTGLGIQCESGGTPTGTNGQVTATLTGQSLTGTIDFSAPPFVYQTTIDTGTITKDGNSGSGTWHVTGTTDPQSRGTWVAGRLVNTPAGTAVTVNLNYNTTITFDNVNSPGGGTQVIAAETVSTELPPNFSSPPELGLYYHVLTTAPYKTGPGAVIICRDYPDANNDGYIDGTSPPPGFDETMLQIRHLESGVWVDRTTSLDTVNNRICATTESLSEFALVGIYAKAGFPMTFHTDRDGNDEIYKMAGDGFGQTNLTNNAASDISPAWSPDGTKIAFASGRDGNYEIYSMNADGSSSLIYTSDAADEG